MASLTPAPRSSAHARGRDDVPVDARPFDREIDRNIDRPVPRSPWVERARDAIDDIVDTTGTARRSLLVGCLFVGVALGGIYWLTRQPPVPVDAALPPIEPASVTTTTDHPPQPDPTVSTEDPVLVHVAGAVNAPGVYELPATAHVIDAVDAAGGLREGADPARINLAAALADGSQVYVPAVGETPPVPVGPIVASVGAEAADTPIDLNRADGAALESLPGVGPATAQAIIEHRERNGPFATVDDLLEVRGIGEAKLAQLRDRVRT